MLVLLMDLLEINVPVWVLIPFEVNIADVVIELQEELVELQCDEIAYFKKESIMSERIVTMHVNILFYGRKQNCTLLPSQHLILLNQASVVCLTG